MAESSPRPALEYHRRTSYQRSRMSGQGLDWASQPDVFKRYPGRPLQALPAEIGLPELTLGQTLARPEPEPPRGLGLDELAGLLHLSYGPTAAARQPGGRFYFRAAPSAGALYPAEVYLACRGVAGLEDGLYHYSVAEHALAQLRRGDLTAWGWADERPALVCFYISGVFFRSAWKYRERAYRYLLLDAGHLTENLVLAGRGLGLPLRVRYDFDDRAVNRLLGLDREREVCLVAARLEGGPPSDRSVPAPAEDDSLAGPSRVSSGERSYTAIQEIHLASERIAAPGPAAPATPAELGLNPGPWLAAPPPEGCPEELDLAQAIQARRSRRNFVRTGLSAACLGRVLAGLRPLDRAERDGGLQVGFVAERVEGLESGFYLLDRERSRLALARPACLPAVMSLACLDQAWLSQAALQFVFLANLERLEEAWGARGYRYAFLSAGRLGQRLYLTATTLRMGACGVGALYDREAADLLGLNDSSGLLYLTGLGPIKK